MWLQVGLKPSPLAIHSIYSPNPNTVLLILIAFILILLVIIILFLCCILQWKSQINGFIPITKVFFSNKKTKSMSNLSSCTIWLKYFNVSYYYKLLYPLILKFNPQPTHLLSRILLLVLSMRCKRLKTDYLLLKHIPHHMYLPSKVHLKCCKN